MGRPKDRYRELRRFAVGREGVVEDSQHNIILKGFISFREESKRSGFYIAETKIPLKYINNVWCRKNHVTIDLNELLIDLPFISQDESNSEIAFRQDKYRQIGEQMRRYPN